MCQHYGAGMQRLLYRIHVLSDADGWRVAVVGTERVWMGGPYATRHDAHGALHVLVTRWQARARARQGWVWRPSGAEIGVALPEGCAVRAALPFVHEPCARSVLQREPDPA